MKTVGEFKKAGLVFVDGDEVHLRWHKASDMYRDQVVSSFVWRENTGVKPEFNGDKEIELRNGKAKLTSKLNAFDNEDWSILGAPSDIVKWRPVVLQSDDAKDKSRHSFVTAISINGPKFTIKEESPKTTMTVNIEGRDYLIASHKTTVSPKEDKPMKPVYTAEMHAKKELPTVDSKVKVCIEEAGFELDGNDTKHEGKVVTVKAAFVNKGGEKIVAIESDKGSCACYIIECIKPIIKPIIKTIKVNGFDVPAPMSEAPMIGDEYFTPQTGYEVFYCKNSWRGDKFDSRFLSRGLVHSTESAAIAHAKAMLGIDPNA